MKVVKVATYDRKILKKKNKGKICKSGGKGKGGEEDGTCSLLPSWG